ncbi:tigger transposable element-derived protein [Elysia marginata]|uniref:Tigger transposable element-derived protein n=1 Tax=Elysia marginata TaxID=1093978 RepID=A0AAV4G0S6_9GAST|nr:tigger transposable element-derived protein [Elysia marginata]
MLDNHSSHISVPAIDFCTDNNIVMLTLPPHAFHKLQPLDRTVFGPSKTYFNSKAQNWMREHPGQLMSIYDLPGIVKEAMPLPMTAHNGIKGFSATGIFS